MATSNETILKVFRLMLIFLRETDENHQLTRRELENEMVRYGYELKKNAIYNEMETLRSFGLEIIKNRQGNKVTYYMANHPLTVQQTKGIIDSIQAARFVTASQFEEIKHALLKLHCRKNASKFNHSLFMPDNKTYNDECLANADIIYDAMAEDHPISFKYCEWNIEKKLVLRREDVYILSPMTLTIDDGKYYMIAYNPHYNATSNYRIDKMRDVTILKEQKRDGAEEFAKKISSGEVTRQMRMYSGNGEHIHLRIDERLCNVIFDDFGIDIPVNRNGDGTFNTVIKVQESDQLYGYLYGLGTGIEILKPERIRNKYFEGLLERTMAYEDLYKKAVRNYLSQQLQKEGEILQTDY